MTLLLCAGQALGRISTSDAESTELPPHCYPGNPKAKNEVTYFTADQFPTKWFLDPENMRPSIRAKYAHWWTGSVHFPDALFYSYNMSESAKEFALTHGHITIWSPWHRSLYNHSAASSNEYSCIHHNATARTLFFENMSRAFATLAKGPITVMHNTTNYRLPPTTGSGIWHRIELRCILDGSTRVTRIRKMLGKDWDSRLAIWDSVKGFIEDSAKGVAVLVELCEYLPERLRGQGLLREKGVFWWHNYCRRRNEWQSEMRRRGDDKRSALLDEDVRAGEMMEAYPLEVDW